MYERNAGFSASWGICDSVLQIGRRMRYTCEYLSVKEPKVRMSKTVYELRVDDALPMNMSALGTLWSPMWITEEPTQAPMLRCARLRIACIMREVLGAA